MFQPVAQNGGRRTEHEEQDTENDAAHHDFPVTLGREQLAEKTHVRRTCQRFAETLRYTDQPGHRQPEHGHTVAHTYA